MSRAFVKEDVEIVERRTRRRSASGLPPGALNYLTARGAEQLRARLAELQTAPERADAEIAHLTSTLSGATIVEPPERSDAAAFGSSVTLQKPGGELETYRIVGVDEVHLAPGNVSWVSAIGKALLGAVRGQTLRLDGEENVVRTVVKID